jgi:hypothetical protein
VEVLAEGDGLELGLELGLVVGDGATIEPSHEMDESPVEHVGAEVPTS